MKANGDFLEPVYENNADRCTFSQMSQRKLFSIDREWLLLERVIHTDSIIKTKIMSALQEAYILPSSRVLLAQYSTMEENVAFYGLHKIVPWTPMKYEFIARTEINKTFIAPQNKYCRNFEGATLRTASTVSIKKLLLRKSFYYHIKKSLF